MRIVMPLALIGILVLLPSAAPLTKDFAKAGADSAQKGCPEVRITCPDIVREGEPMTFTVNVTGGDAKVTPIYNWTVSAGTISSGQGTPSITVETQGLGGQAVTATVQVEGYSRDCSTTRSCTVQVQSPPSPRAFDSFDGIGIPAEQKRLDRFASALQNEPQTQAFVISYGGRCSSAGEGRRRTDRARQYLVGTRGIDSPRVVTIDGGLRECVETELWIVPGGSASPSSYATLDSSAKCSRRKKRGCDQ